MLYFHMRKRVIFHIFLEHKEQFGTNFRTPYLYLKRRPVLLSQSQELESKSCKDVLIG